MHLRVPLRENEKNELENGSLTKSKKYFRKFCENTSIHGMQYFARHKKSFVGKACWSVIMAVSFLLCCAFITRTCLHWMYSPVIVTFATKQTLISKIPFPALTICPSAKSHAAAFNFSDIFIKTAKHINVTEDEETRLKYMSLLCDLKYTATAEIESYNESAVEFLEEVSLKDVISMEYWNPKPEESNIFIPTLTSDGFCVTFNMLGPKDIFRHNVFTYNGDPGKNSSWSLHSGYSKENAEVYPRRTFAPGFEGGLIVIMKTQDDDTDYLCKTQLQGFKIALHNPAEIPNMAEQYVLVPLDAEVVGTITPNMMKTHPSLESYSPHLRQCYFEGEKRLRYFKTYNQENCLLECLTNATLKWCGCVEFYMPHTAGTPICTQFQLLCIDFVKETYLTGDFRETILDYEIDQFYDVFNSSSDSEDDGCVCFPACVSLKYDVKTSISKWNWREFFRTLAQTKRYRKVRTNQRAHFSQLMLFFKKMQFMASERSELYGTGQLLANWGGLLGLFVGFSVISLFEIAYFIMLKWTDYMRKSEVNKKWVVAVHCFLLVVLMVFAWYVVNLQRSVW